jgi:uncharacterized protein YidB (DUF937 family)
MSDAISKLLSQLTSGENGGLNGLIDKFKSSGLADKVDSWIGHGENKPVTGDQVTQVLGDDHVAKIAETAGVSRQEAADALAQKLPQAVDQLTPEGQVPSAQSLQEGMSKVAGSTGTQS